MGADYTAKAIIGLKIDPARLHVDHTVKAYPHDHPSTMNFDPQNGNPLWKIVKIPIDGFDEGKEKLFGYELVFGTDDDSAFVCLFMVDDTYSNGGNDEAMLKIPENLSLHKAKMKADLGGLWDEEEFGLWTVLSCSY